MATRRNNNHHHAGVHRHLHVMHLGGRSMSRRRNVINRTRNRSEISFCVKYTVFGFNVVFWALGFLLLGIGLWSRLEKNNLYSQLSLFYLDPAWVLIIVGAIIWSIGFSGCVGALRENTCFLAIYSSILGLLLLTEALIVVLAFVAKDFVENDLGNKLDSMIVHYRDDPDLQTIIDWMQNDFQCCGISDPDDWDKNIYFNASAKALKSPEAGGVPYSCCKNIDKTFINYACGYATRVSQSDNGPKQFYHSNIHTEGCLPKLQSWLNNNFLYVGAAVFVVAVVQFLGICFAQDLRSDIFAQRAKWTRQS
ncbi:Tetraspanin [Meloidogyne graminicola]|uniref:Tetraspanin n=1 Tax=Meloidogyne graminicola TaxID=189291 RepID=A0A8S9ZTR0_9BILA|nr:Tetraspanin [Meloidogyne graminicola]